MQKKESVNLITLFHNFYRYKWSILLIITSILIATFFYTKQTTPIYSSSILINIKSDKDSGIKSLFPNGNIININMEEKLNYNITILKSRLIISKVLNKIDLSKRFFIKGEWRDRELYKKEIPFLLEFDNKKSDNNNSVQFSIEELDRETFSFRLKGQNDNNKTEYYYKYGQDIKNNKFGLRIYKKDKKSSLKDKKYTIKIENNEDSLISNILSNLSVEKKVGRLLNISYEDTVPLRAKDIVTQLVSSYEEYNLHAIQLKDVSNISFLDKSIVELEHKLKEIGDKIRVYRLNHTELLSLNLEDKIFSNTIEKNEKIVILSLKLNALRVTKARLKDGIYSSTLLENSNLQIKDIGQLIVKLRDKESHLALLVKQKKNMNILLINASSFGNIFAQLKKAKKELRVLTNEYTNEYPKVKQIQIDIKALESELSSYIDDTINLYSSDIKRVKKEINKTIQSLINSTKKEYSELEKSLKKDKMTINKLPKSTMKLKELQREFEINENNYKKLLQTRSESLISKELTISNIQIVDKARESTNPIKPKKSFLYIAGFILGLLIAIIYTSLRIYRNRSIYSKNDISLPDYSLIYNKKRKINENLWTLVSFLEKSITSQESKIIFITSGDYNENKSLTTKELSLVLRDISKRVLIIDFDVYNPKIIENSAVGLSTLLTSKHSLEEIYVEDYIKYTNKEYEGIDILPSGPILPNGVSLLFNSKIRIFLEYLSTRYDYILMDVPPLGKYPETAILLKYIDTLLVVAKIEKTDKRFFEKLNRINIDMGDIEKVIFLTNE